MDKKIFTVYMHVTPNNKKYIGMTCNETKIRWARGGGYKNQKHFYRAINKYKWENIKHIIIAKKLTKEQACNLEIELIKIYDTTNIQNGYNKSLGGECPMYGLKHSDETKIKMSLLATGDKNPMYKREVSSETKELLSKKRAGRKFSKETREKISISNSGKKRSEKTKKDYSNASKKRWESEEYREKMRRSRMTPVLQFDKNMRFIKEWDCVLTASAFYNIGKGGIYGCCSKRKEHFYGCIWIYKKDYDGEITPLVYSEEKLKQTISKSVGVSEKTRQKMRKKPVLQFDKEMNFIREFESATMASNFLGIAKTNIGACCIGKLKTSGGFIWKFKD